MWVTAGAADRKGWPARNNGTASTLSRYALIFIPWFRVVPPTRSVSQFCIGRIGVLASSRYYYARYIIKFPLLWKQELIEEGEEERASLSRDADLLRVVLSLSHSRMNSEKCWTMIGSDVSYQDFFFFIGKRIIAKESVGLFFFFFFF